MLQGGRRAEGGGLTVDLLTFSQFRVCVFVCSLLKV